MEYVLLKLNNGSKFLSSVKALSRGFNRKFIECVITSSYTESATTYFQNKGRGIRVNELDMDNVVTIINIYFNNTIEEKKLKNNQITVINQGGKIVYTDDYNDLNNNNNDVYIKTN